MKALWKRIEAYVDAMSLRERVILFACASLLIVGIAYAAMIDPMLGNQKAMIATAARDQSQLAAVRGQIEKLVQEEQADARRPELAALRELERRIAGIERDLAIKQRGFLAPERLPALLKEMLGRGPAVRLESLRLLPSAAMPKPVELYRHGVEITLKGSYFDLVQYLAQLEKLPDRLLWGSVQLQVEEYPQVKLTLVVYTLSKQRSLLKG
jgi:MSHA biogenesis protein MshJ